MSDAELARQLDGEWRELVEAELERRREESLTRADGADIGVVAVGPAQSPMQLDEGADIKVAAAHPAQLPTSPLEANWRSRITRFLRSIFKK